MRLSNLQLQFTITSACVIMCFIAKWKIRKQQELIEQIIDEYYTEKIKIKKKTTMSTCVIKSKVN